jgi:hypothetical protein
LLISQQNIAEKQRIHKKSASPHSHSLDLSNNSPQKHEITQKRHKINELVAVSCFTNPENSPEKLQADIHNKWSFEKSSSNSESLDP